MRDDHLLKRGAAVHVIILAVGFEASDAVGEAAHKLLAVWDRVVQMLRCWNLSGNGVSRCLLQPVAAGKIRFPVVGHFIKQQESVVRTNVYFVEPALHELANAEHDALDQIVHRRRRECARVLADGVDFAHRREKPL